MGAVKGCHVCVPLLKESKGLLINVASMAGLLHMGSMSAYNVSKAGMVALSEGLLSELDPYGVKVSVVCPTFFQSNLAKSMRSDNPDAAKIAARLHAGNWHYRRKYCHNRLQRFLQWQALYSCRDSL